MLDKGWWWSGDWVQGFCLVRPIPTSRRGTPWLYYSWQDILPSVVQPGYPHPTSKNGQTKLKLR